MLGVYINNYYITIPEFEISDVEVLKKKYFVVSLTAYPGIIERFFYMKIKKISIQHFQILKYSHTVHKS